jgi:hypothetical protein
MLKINLKPSTKQLRQFGYIAVVALSILAAVAFFKNGLLGFDFGESTPLISGMLLGAGLLLGSFSLVAPHLNRYPFLFLTFITYPIGFCLSYVIMIFLFYGVITPVGLLLRLVGRDPLQRRFEPDAPTYWVSPTARKSKEDYFKQF